MFIFPFFYFTASYIIFLNFPCISESMHRKPVYYEDLTINREGVENNTFQRVYSIVMNFILAIIFSAVSEYVIIQGVDDKPLAEITAVVGGNIFLFVKIQDAVGKVLLYMCFYIKDNKRISDTLTDSMNSDIQLNCVRGKSVEIVTVTEQSDTEEEIVNQENIVI
jgi:hypothetical protein